MAVWSFKRKRNPFGVITKYKARLCVHGGQTVRGVHYEASYSPVVSWTTICLLLTLTLVLGWYTRQINFVLAFPQAHTRTDLFMEVPSHFEVINGELSRNTSAPNPRHQPNVLKLLKNLYGLKDAGLTWFEHLKGGLESRGFRQSLVEPCMFVKDKLILLVYGMWMTVSPCALKTGQLRTLSRQCKMTMSLLMRGMCLLTSESRSIGSKPVMV
jgi:hypothetical protein